VQEEGDPPSRYLIQTTNIWGGTVRSLDLHLLHHFKADGLVLAAVSDLLTNPGKLALDRQKLSSLLRPAGSPSPEAVIFRLDVGKSLCYFRGIPVSLTKTPFDVLVLLAREALAGPGWVSRDRIFERCWREDWERGVPPNDEQITKMVSDVRNALRDAARLSLNEARQLVQTKSKVGYRLNLRPDEIEVI
jgi:DNA-binding winged helix-turn-helix (wHTH) protein